MTETSEPRNAAVASLEDALQYFKEHQTQFARENHEFTIATFFDNELDAYMEATKQYQEGSFLLRRCLRPDANQRWFSSAYAGPYKPPDSPQCRSRHAFTTTFEQRVNLKTKIGI